MALTSSEAESVAVASASQRGIWLQRILRDLDMDEKESFTMFCDKMSAISLSKNLFSMEEQNIQKSSIITSENKLMAELLICNIAQLMIK